MSDETPTKQKILKGRIVIYSIVGCPHCLQAKSTLQKIGLPYVDVSVDRFPDRIRNWLREKTGRTSVPQIFFNSKYVGGNAELQKLVADAEKLKTFVDEVEQNDPPDESDPLLPHPSEATDVSGGIDFQCELDEYSALVAELKESGIVKDRKTCMFGLFSRKQREVFSGKDFVDWAVEKKSLTREKAVEMGREFITRKFGHSVEPDEEFKDDDTLYELRPENKDDALNADKPSDCVQRPAVEVAEDLRKLILQLFAQYLSPDGKRVDYKGIQSSEVFERSYKAIARELQRVDLKAMDRNEKLAFFINIYNALVIHGNIERGTPANTWQRYKFFSTVAYDIGGHIFSLNDIENGVLRANRGSMATLYRTPFKKGDARLGIALENAEPRIHFALNCGAKSCPPIKTFSPAGIDDQLDAATESYLENDDALKVEPDTSTVHVSMLFKWYQQDFGDDKSQVLDWIKKHAGSQAQSQLANVRAESVKLKYIPYDWGHNSKD